jgi:molybdopterin/thiamine biosynthesis adenylyltransferase
MITIVGAGALGSHVALFLRNEKEGLRIVDFDRVEFKNTQAQFHTKMSLGKNKAQALQQGFKGLFGVNILSVIPYKLTQNNVKELLEGSELVIDCTDNFQARNDISAAVRNMGIPCLHGALSADGSFAVVMWDEHFKPDAETGDGATCEDGEHLPFFAAASAHLAMEAQLFLRTGKKRSFQITPSGIVRVA